MEHLFKGFRMRPCLETTTGLDGTDPPQAHPLSGYYHDILSSRSPYRRQATSSSCPVPERTDKPSPSSTIKPLSPQDKMSIVFGTRLAGPGRSSRYNPGTMPPESTWKTINGVAIPPRPEEPDNCCMSGCVHCVWDDYRDEMEEWAARVEQAKAKGASKGLTGDMRHTPRAEVDSASTSMDDDGGGSGVDTVDESQDVREALPSEEDYSGSGKVLLRSPKSTLQSDFVQKELIGLKTRFVTRDEGKFDCVCCRLHHPAYLDNHNHAWSRKFEVLSRTAGFVIPDLKAP
ncbi:hypothetical protein ETB97_011135 [Aspergillus alliaceus]|uniref:Oxidoreductase-like domain-containing protein n=1 Tax=Petromyces alliaceus TaxID=209559 RepID=A0A8H6E7X2_PETAA|nr:hypothetical protein ETB97_011135 [Aspergillus burnettii]